MVSVQFYSSRRIILWSMNCFIVRSFWGTTPLDMWLELSQQLVDICRALFFLPIPAGEHHFRKISFEENETFSRKTYENGKPNAYIQLLNNMISWQYLKTVFFHHEELFMVGFIIISCEIWGFPSGNACASMGKVTPWVYLWLWMQNQWTISLIFEIYE